MEIAEMNQKRKKQQPKAVIVGGSIGGVSCAHSLTLAGWDVVVLEKSSGPTKGSPTGAGLGLDPLSQRVIESWLGKAASLEHHTLPMEIDLNQATDGEMSWVLTRDENFNYRAAHWANLHSLLYDALPHDVVLWGHHYLSFYTSDDKTSVKVKAKVEETNETIEIEGDLLIGADGCLSSIRRSFLPDLKLRYSGYCAWRGVLDFSGLEDSETIIGIRRAYPELGKCLYLGIGSGTHSVLFELPDKRLNWIWYVNQPEPPLKVGGSVTMKVSDNMIKQMHKEAEKVWVPELVTLMKETKEPFLNVIYDCDPLERIIWDNVVLVGDAAHPTTPHCSRSTNMSVIDAAVLGKCFKKWGADNLHLALEEFQSTRLPVTSKQVLHSRRVGRIKQGLNLPDRKLFDPKTASPEECQELQHKLMPFFAGVPLSLGSRYSLD